jgi:L-alanine-DL-glutamate epimerase-like enolase superfamily enzyme
VKETVEVFVVEAAYGRARGLGSGTPATSIGDTVKKCEKAFVQAGSYAVDLETYFEDEINGEICEISPSAAAAVDMAVWNLRAKMDGVNLAVALGGSLKELPTDMTIDLVSPGDAASEATRLVKDGFGSIKVKVGRSLGEDLERVKAARKAAGRDVRIFIDANGGYDEESAAKLWDRAADLKLDFFEQPVPPDMLEELASLRERGIRVCADESFIGEASLRRIIELEAADMINIKLMKCGGITSAMRLAKMAEDAGLETMVGCMGDVGISIAAAAHLACVLGPRQVDLDSHLNIAPICDGPPIENGRIILRDEPGLGVNLIGDWQNWKV